MSEGDKVLSQLEVLKRGLDEPGPARPLSPEREQALLDAALGERSVALQGTRGLRVAVAVALVAIGAAAALGVWRLQRVESTEDAVSPPPSAHAPGSALSPSVRPAPSAAVHEATEPADPDRLEPTPTPNAASRVAPSASGDTAKEVDLLKQANDLRRSGDFAGAEKLYRQVIQVYPQTTSAYVAMSSVASLAMNRDPAGAVEMYRAARRARPAGALDLEIRQGLARGYRKLGQVGAERRELEELIARYPNAEASERGKARLAELSAAAPR